LAFVGGIACILLSCDQRYLLYADNEYWIAIADYFTIGRRDEIYAPSPSKIMTTKEAIAQKSIDILASSNQVLFHKKRFATLCKRIETVVNIVKGIDATDTTTIQAFDFLYTTLEDIKDYVTIFSTKNTVLANRVIIYGSDEEQFIKWNERFQHCIDTLGKSDRLGNVFDEKVDLKDFETDVSELRKSLRDIMLLLENDNISAHLAQLLRTVEGLIGHQTMVRATYQTKTAPTAAIEINPKRIKYEEIIGRGGISLF
jgi:hypothetical protein